MGKPLVLLAALVAGIVAVGSSAGAEFIAVGDNFIITCYMGELAGGQCLLGTY